MKILNTASFYLLILFIVSLGLIGPLNVDISKVFYCIGVLLLLLFKRSFFKETILENRSFLFLQGFVLYGIILFFIYIFIPTNLKPTYALIEELLFNYTLLPMSAIFFSLALTPKRLKTVLTLFSLSVVLCSLFILYSHHGLERLFTDTSNYLTYVVSSRLTASPTINYPIVVFLKDYSFYPTIAGFISFAFLFKAKRSLLLAHIILFLINTAFLFATVNRGTMIGLVIAMIIYVVYYLIQTTLIKKILIASSFIIFSITLLFYLPDSVTSRFKEIPVESELFIKEGHNTGSASTRFTIWKILLSHADSFFLIGDGPQYANNKLSTYLQEAGRQDYVDAGYIHHNSYLAYFQYFGILGLLFLLALFIYPIILMVRQKRVSIFYLSFLILLFIPFMEDRYVSKAKVSILLFFIYFLYLQREALIEIFNPSKKR